MVAFNNVSLNYGNISDGPDIGRIYSIDHTTSTLIVKTFPAGALVSSIPSNVAIGNEVISLQYDGYYFYTLQKLGSSGDLGMVVNKWLLSGNSLVKQLGVDSELQLINGGGQLYDSEAFCVHRYITRTSYFIAVNASNFIIADSSYLSIGDSIYFGPSTAASGERRKRKVIGVSGNTVYLDTPLDVQFNQNDQVIYIKNIWVFNNYNNGSVYDGSLIQINSNTGLVASIYSSCEWKYATASNCINGNIGFTRGVQFLQYKPFGSNAGYQSSATLNNTEVNNNTLIKIYDFWTDSSNIYKLQKKQHQYDTVNFIFTDVISTNNNFNVDTEQQAAKVFSITTTRANSVLYGLSATDSFLIKIRDQFDLPVFGRAISVTEDDASGLVSSGSSFITNTQGEGNSIYNSGLTPDFSIPTVYIRDISSSLRYPIKLIQTPKTLGKTQLIQRSKLTSGRQVIQQKITSKSPVIQGISFKNAIPIAQYKPATKTTLSQYKVTSNYNLSQVPPASCASTVTQYAALNTYTQVNQFNFLIYALPLPYSKKNQPNTNILVRIAGFGGTSLNVNTLIFRVNGADVTSQVVVTPFSGGLELFYNPVEDFPYSSTVSINITIQDMHSPVRTIATSYTFDVIADYKKPIILEVYPPNKSINNLTDTEVYCIIQDRETGVDQSSIELYVEGLKVIPIITSIDNNTVKVSYNISNNTYPYDSPINVGVLVSDLNNNQTLESWEFTTQPSPGVLFIEENPGACDYLVPVDSSICIEAFGFEAGINIESTEYYVEDKPITYVIKPRIYRSE